MISDIIEPQVFLSDNKLMNFSNYEMHHISCPLRFHVASFFFYLYISGDVISHIGKLGMYPGQQFNKDGIFLMKKGTLPTNTKKKEEHLTFSILFILLIPYL